MKLMCIYSAMALLWLAGCGSAAPFEKAHFSTTAMAPTAPPATFVGEVPKGYQTMLESKNGTTHTRWDYVYNDSSRLYVATTPERILDRSDSTSLASSAKGAGRGGMGAIAKGDTAHSGQDAAGLYWMEREVAGLRVGYKRVPHARLYLFNYFVETFQEKR